MKSVKNQSVMGVTAPSSKPDFRGFMMLGVLIAAPTGAVLFGVEVVIRWAFQWM